MFPGFLLLERDKAYPNLEKPAVLSLGLCLVEALPPRGLHKNERETPV